MTPRPWTFLSLDRRRTAAAMATLAAMGSAAALADQIELKTGRVVQGIVVAREGGKVYVKIGGATTKYDESLIKSVTESSPADNRLLDVNALMARSPAIGIALLAECARAGASAEALAVAMLRNSEEIAGAIPSLKTEDREALRSAIDAAGEAKLLRAGDFLVAELHWRLLLEDAPRVREIMERFKSEEPATLKREKEKIADWISERVGAALEDAKYSEALDLLIEMRAVSQERAGFKRAEMALLWARGEREKKEFAKAIQIYATQLMDESPAIARERIGVTLGEAEQAYRDAGELGRAIDLYEQYGVEYDAEASRKRLIELWREMGWELLRAGKSAQARQFFERLEKESPGSAADDLRHCDYLDAKGKLAADDYAGHYKLGEWCVEGGLLDEAAERFAWASGAPELRPAVTDQVRRLQNLVAERDLGKLLDLYEKGEYIQVMAGIGALESKPLSEGFRQQAEQLEALTKTAMEIAAKERPQQAEVLWQQAERAYFLEGPGKAYNLLKEVMERYPDTPAGAHALAFYRKIRPRLDINAMEQSRHRRREFPSLEGGGVGGESVGGEGAAKSEGAAGPPEDPEQKAIAEEIRRLREGMKSQERERP